MAQFANSEDSDDSVHIVSIRPSLEIICLFYSGCSEQVQKKGENWSLYLRFCLRVVALWFRILLLCQHFVVSRIASPSAFCGS